MKSDAPTVLDVSAIDVGYFSTKFALGRKIVNNQFTIGRALIPSLAPTVASERQPDAALLSRPDGTLIKVNGVNYFVGRDAVLSSKGREPRQVLDDYCMTDKYLALVRGALHYIFKDAGATGELVIRQLVVGLPINNLARFRKPLTERLVGEHLLPDCFGRGTMRRVTIERVLVIAQPQGALTYYAVSHKASLEDRWALVVDAGGGTLDWFLTLGRRPNWERSGAYPKSMLACAYAVSDSINPTWRDNYEIMDRIDKAIRSKATTFSTGGKTYELEPHRAAIDAVLSEATAQLATSVASFENLDLILFTGGGAHVFYEFMKARYPQQAQMMHVDEDPVYSNVMGFYLAGELLAKAISA